MGNEGEIDRLKDSVNFLEKAFQPDKEKLVLPVVMTVLLIAGAASTLQLQQSYGEKSLNTTVEVLTELKVLEVKNQSYPEEINGSTEQMRQTIIAESEREKEKLKQQPGFTTKAFMSMLVFKSGAFPLAPEKELAPWGPEKEYIRAVNLARYRTSRIGELAEKANNSENYSYSSFQKDLGEIKKAEWNSSEVQNYLEDQNKTSGSLGVLGQLTYRKVKSDGVSNLNFSSFSSSILATFLLYYIIGCLAVQTNRGLKEAVMGDSNEE